MSESSSVALSSPVRVFYADNKYLVISAGVISSISILSICDQIGILRPTLHFCSRCCVYTIKFILNHTLIPLYEDVCLPCLKYIIIPVGKYILIIPKQILSKVLHPIWRKVCKPWLRLMFISIPRWFNNKLIQPLWKVFFKPIWLQFVQPCLRFSFQTVPTWVWKHIFRPIFSFTKKCIRFACITTPQFCFSQIKRLAQVIHRTFLSPTWKKLKPTLKYLFYDLPRQHKMFFKGVCLCLSGIAMNQVVYKYCLADLFTTFSFPFSPSSLLKDLPETASLGAKGLSHWLKQLSLVLGREQHNVLSSPGSWARFFFSATLGPGSAYL